MSSIKLRLVVITGAGVLFAAIVSVLVTILAHVALYLLDVSRGLDDDWLQTVFRDWFTPGVGGYAAMYSVKRYLNEANLKWVGIIFCTVFSLMITGFPLYMAIFYGFEYISDWSELVSTLGGPAGTCIGAYVAYQHIEGEK